jgi:hypothetical protein
MSLRVSLTGLSALLAAGLSCRAEQLQLRIELDGAAELKVQPAVVQMEELGEWLGDLKLDIPELKKLPEDAVKKGKYGVPEADEKPMVELAKKAAELRRGELEKELDAAIKQIVEAAKLDDAAKKKLEDLRKPAVDESMEDWVDKACQFLAPTVMKAGGAEKGLRAYKASTLARTRMVKPGSSPEETKAWKEGVKAALSAEQFAAVEKLEKERREEMVKEFKDFLDASEDQLGQRVDMAMERHLQSILLYGSIDEERSKKLKEAAAAAVKETLSEWRKRAEKKLLAMDERSREQMMQNNGFMGLDSTEEDSKPENLDVWKTAVKGLIKEDELKAIEARRGEVKKRRASALAMVVVADADRFLGLSEEQRNKLLELSTEPMLSLGTSFYESPENGYYSLNVGEMLDKVKEAGKEKMKDQLSEAQQKRLKDLTQQHISRNNYIVREYREASDFKIEDENDVERYLSKYLYEESKAIKRRVTDSLEARIETLQRVAKPDEKALTLLRTAAKGAAEQMARSSIQNLDNYIRSQFAGVTPADAAQRLRSLYNPYGNDRNLNTDVPLWTTAVERVLTAEQREIWKKETDARDLWRRRSLVNMALTEAEKRIIMKPESLEPARAKLGEVLAKYETDINNSYSFSWHLQGYYTCLPLAMLEDAELEKLFGKEQMETITDKLLPNVRRLADSIKQQHKNRTR